MKELDLFKNVLSLEADAIQHVASLINDSQIQSLSNFLNRLVENHGKLFIAGVGKSGHIACKIASTISSLGLPAFFIHPVEAMHGDYGRISSNDGLIILSKSGTTSELDRFLSFNLKISKENIIGLLGNIDGSLKKYCAIIFNCYVEKEACLNNQAPTSSSTVTLAVGDAIGVLYEHLIGLDKFAFAKNHPGGLLGKSLSLKVKSLMIKFDECAKCSLSTSLKEVLIEMTSKPHGACAVIDESSKSFQGLIVEGDIRRLLLEDKVDLNRMASSVMNQNPIFVSSSHLAVNALIEMEQRQKPVYVLPVIDKGLFTGFLRMHDLMKEGLS